LPAAQTFNAALMAKTCLRRYAHATINILKNVGHYPMNEMPLALVTAIESFLKSSAASPAGEARPKKNAVPEHSVLAEQTTVCYRIYF